MTRPRVLICPFCGETQPETDRCRACRSGLDRAARRRLANSMGPWFVRDEDRPFVPGISYEALVGAVERGEIDRFTIVRGPTTRQLWTIAKRVPGLAHLLGWCHGCGTTVDADDHGCYACGARFGALVDRNFLGVPDRRPVRDGDDGELVADDQEDLTGQLGEDRSVGDGGLPTETEAAAAGSAAPAPAARAAGAQVADSPRPAPDRISAFAADHELMDITHLDDEPDAPWPVPRPAAAPVAPRPGSASGPVAEAAPIPRVRRRTSRGPGTMSMVIAGGAVLSLVVAIGLTVLGNAGDPGGAETSPAADDGRPLAEDSAAPTADHAEAGDGVAPGDEPASGDAAALAESGAAAAPGPVDPAVRRAPLLEDARTLSAPAAVQSRSVADRITDYELALSVLAELAADEGFDGEAAGLPALIESTGRALERLRLKTFYP